MEVDTMHNACDDMSAAKALSKQNRVTIIIELAENGEPMWEGAINGCIFRIRRGEPVEVPESLAKLIAYNAHAREAAKAAAEAYVKYNGKRL